MTHVGQIDIFWLINPTYLCTTRSTAIFLLGKKALGLHSQNSLFWYTTLYLLTQHKLFRKNSYGWRRQWRQWCWQFISWKSFQNDKKTNESPLKGRYIIPTWSNFWILCCLQQIYHSIRKFRLGNIKNKQSKK